LKGGDPFVFGRGGEEAQALVEAGIPFEIVPGVTSAIAVPAYAGIPVTQRGMATSVAFITGHCAGSNPLDLNWQALAQGIDTLVFLMGVHGLPTIVAPPQARFPSDTPVALIEHLPGKKLLWYAGRYCCQGGESAALHYYRWRGGDCIDWWFKT
jgi:siroheme synthase